jgi:hypothetical protein
MHKESREQDAIIETELDMPGLTLLERLEIERHRMGWTQQRFAAHLGMSPTVWRDLRKGKTAFSAHHYVAIIGQLPALRGYVYRHLAHRARTERS